MYVHHTVLVDPDAPDNEWQTLEEVKSSMRRLQQIRPDLGLDVPYNMVAFCMSDDELVLCEGRGVGRTGAHTRNHNRSALGIAFQGDFEDQALPENIDAQLSAFAEWLRDLRNNQGFSKLGYSRPDDKQVWGHRDSPTASTACPGQKLYDKLTLIRFIDEEDDTALDKSTWRIVQLALQAQNPPLYAGKAIDGKPGKVYAYRNPCLRETHGARSARSHRHPQQSGRINMACNKRALVRDRRSRPDCRVSSSRLAQVFCSRFPLACDQAARCGIGPGPPSAQVGNSHLPVNASPRYVLLPVVLIVAAIVPHNFCHVEIVQLAFRLRNAVLTTAWVNHLATKRTER